MLPSPRPATEAWLNALHAVLRYGIEVSPRGMLTREYPQQTHAVDMRFPVVYIPERKLSYKFLCAEALWIISGDNHVATIAPYNPNIAQFSDDGVTFSGAYGPPIKEQFDYVVSTLLSDPDTRRAVWTTWRPNPASSKDIPCTVAMSFMRRGTRLNAHVFMRSNDLWLGWVYDVFNFTMLARRVLCEMQARDPSLEYMQLGDLYYTSASSHLYEQHWDQARFIVDQYRFRVKYDPTLAMPQRSDWLFYQKSLEDCRDNIEHIPGNWRIRP